MKTKAILFDLDGTLLPMEDQGRFIKLYFDSLTEYMAGYGYEPKKFTAAMWHSVIAMMKNDGSEINENVFWREFEGIYGERAIADRAKIDEFYGTHFAKARAACGYSSRAKEIVELVKATGRRVILATNPVFPRVATEMRIGWAGCSPSDFELVTAYDNSSSSKPNGTYYKEILEKTGLLPEECLMVGNDTRDDMSAQHVGIRTFLLTDCLINEAEEDISKYPHGDFDALAEYIKNLD